MKVHSADGWSEYMPVTFVDRRGAEASPNIFVKYNLPGRGRSRAKGVGRRVQPLFSVISGGRPADLPDDAFRASAAMIETTPRFPRAALLY